MYISSAKNLSYSLVVTVLKANLIADLRPKIAKLINVFNKLIRAMQHYDNVSIDRITSIHYIDSNDMIVKYSCAHCQLCYQIRSVELVMISFISYSGSNMFVYHRSCFETNILKKCLKITMTYCL